MFNEPTLADIPTPAQMVEAMDGTVAGLEEIKQRLAWTLYRHQVSAVKRRQWRPPNLLVLGQSGSGKTHTLRALTNCCKVIWTEATATEYSDVGFTGRNLTSMYSGLFSPRWHGDMPTDEGGEVHPPEERIELAERFGVVIFDEFDKLRADRKSAVQDRQGGKAWAMQAELLKMSEGTEVRVKETDDSEGFYFNTHHVLHIASGAFQGIAQVIADNEEVAAHPALHEKAQIQHIVQYGFMEELVGRFSSIIALPLLTPAAMRRILVEQILPKYAAELQDLGTELIVDETGISALIGRCISDPTGARSIEPMLSKILWPAWNQSANQGDGGVITIDSDAVSSAAQLTVSRSAAA